MHPDLNLPSEPSGSHIHPSAVVAMQQSLVQISGSTLRKPRLSLIAALALAVLSPIQSVRAQGIPDLKCGVNCLHAALSTLNAPAEAHVKLEEIVGLPTAEGYSISQLAAAARQLGLQATAVQTTPENLLGRQRPFVCIALLNQNHFAILADVEDDTVVLLDPPRTRRTTLTALQSQWDGKALILSGDPLESEENLAARLRGEQMRTTLVHRGGLVMVLGFSFGTVGLLRRRRAASGLEQLRR